MTPEEYIKKRELLDEEFDKVKIEFEEKRKQINKEYFDSIETFKKDDIITDGRIVIKVKSCHYNDRYNRIDMLKEAPRLFYKGIKLTQKGEKRKTGGELIDIIYHSEARFFNKKQE